MKREDLIRKWLDNELSSEELQVFKQLEDYEDLIKLSNATKAFKADAFDANTELERLNGTLNRNNKKRNWLKPLLRVAAIFAICFSTYYYTTTLDTITTTDFAQKETIALPDASNVTINALSSITYNNNSWKENREVKLNGEAYFKVEKSSKFSVKTNNGIVTVLGTEFNVKDRDGIFEVVCYEGSVSVQHKSELVILKPGDGFLIIDNTVVNIQPIKQGSPTWIANESTFKSKPLKLVLAELERQYNVTFNVKNIDTKQLFTGSFGHNDLDIALKAITLPLNLTFVKLEQTITLKSE